MTEDGAIGESRGILAWTDERGPAARRLFPAEPAERAQVEALSRRFDELLGPHARRLIYVHVLADPETMLAYNNAGVPGWEDRMLRLLWPLGKRWVSRAVGIRPGIEQRDEEVVFAELDRVAELLADGRPYLCGERFSAADLTFAALSAAVTAPPGYGTPLPQPEAMRPPTAALVERARDHPAGRFALRMFAERERSAVPASGGF